MNTETNFSRRDLLKGAGILGATAALGATLAGCGPQNAKADGTTTPAKDALLGEAEPIDPVDVPDSWDAEADVIVVGMGGGGLAAATYLAQQGKRVIALEKEGSVGGATRHAFILVNAYGGSTAQNEMQYGWPTWPLDMNAFLRAYARQHQYSTDDNLIRNLAGTAGEALDWLTSQEGTSLVCLGPGYADAAVLADKQNHVLGMDNTVNAIEQCALDAGADIRCLTECKALVMEDGAVAGVLAQGSDGESFIQATDGVIFCAGGFGMNKDLMQTYLPSAFQGVVQGGPMPFHTGEALRMGLGAGADVSGFDSWCCWESGIDESIAGGDGNFWHYFWHGERQLFHNPWLIIDETGARAPYYSLGVSEDLEADPQLSMGDLHNCSAWMSRVGHHVYSICDSKFPELVFSMKRTNGADTSRIPITEEESELLLDTGGLVSADWLAEVEEAVERGAIKKADTLEELADMLHLDRTILVEAVENWNGLCERGVDDELATPYDPSWLNPLQDPPYYAAILGGQMSKTGCGLRVDSGLRVQKSDGSTIPGLYANFTTAGGIVGECDYGGYWNSSLFGGNGMSWISGYVAAKTVLDDAQ